MFDIVYLSETDWSSIGRLLWNDTVLLGWCWPTNCNLCCFW